MERKLKRTPLEAEYSEATTDRISIACLHPAQAFEHPSNVVTDPDLTLNEKRAILASWASDACAIEAAPALRYAPGGKKPVRFDDVMEALRALDKQAQRPRMLLAIAASCGASGSASDPIPATGIRGTDIRSTRSCARIAGR